jgi:glutamine amidotransferase
MSVLIIDYGMGNLGSVRRSLEECGANVIVSDNPTALETATLIVLPGVGSFAQGMDHLKTRGWIETIRKAALDEHIPLLGICLGMQLLADMGNEGGNIQGLGLIPGKVKKLTKDSPQTRIPHIGWNEVYTTRINSLFNGIANGSDFYFVHSYHFVVEKKEHIIATSPYCGDIVSAVMAENIFGVQFHPEKSSRPGFQLLRNFLNIYQ